ncbi:MAG: RidA family protein [Gammaproteobacteria bacterium]|nr:RidA family protein [Gammaproteobacteria bacterium]
MQRKSINPTEWGLAFAMDQAEITEGAKRHLRCSGQVAVAPDPDAELGFSVIAPGEIRAQMQAALANVDDVLTTADMTRSDIVSLRFFTTDIDGFLENYDVYADWIGSAGIRPPQSLLGVQRLVLPDIVVEIEVEAAA